MLKTDLSRYDNSWWDPGHRIGIWLWYLVNPLTINTYLPFPVALKRWILRRFGAKIGKNVIIKPKVNIKSPWFLTIDDNVWIGECVWIDNLTNVSIGANACLSQGAMLLTGNHDFTKTTFDLQTKEIHLAEGVWIGAQAVVCPGVTCYSHAVLTVNSVATKPLEAYCIYQGNPAVFVKQRIINS
ncbi:MAG: WcaF family extracellular polysaccharide biosynthesis acetyltransferase [Spirosomataceae bacterium]